VPACIRPDVSTTHPEALQNRQLQILSKFRIREVDTDVWTMLVSRPDVSLHTARIAIQISRSRRQTALVRTCVQLIWKLPIRLQPSGRLPFLVRTRALQIWKLRVEVHGPDASPPWSGRAKPYMEVTCRGRATVRTSVSHRPDAALKQERFSAEFSENPVTQLSVWTAKVHRPDGIRTKHYSRPFEPSAYK
jgi:hypothetical protein